MICNCAMAGTSACNSCPSKQWVNEGRFPTKVFFTYGVDAVEVVRCKDCKHLNKEEMRCFEVEGLGYRNVADDDFCSRGERKDEVTE